METQTAQDVQRLTARDDRKESIAPGESHRYSFDLEAGDYVEIVAEQQGVDVALIVLDPEGRMLLEVDSPTGRAESEVARLVSASSGEFRIEVHAVEEDAPEGSYQLRMSQPRQATETDHKRAEATLNYTQVFNASSQGSIKLEDTINGYLRVYQIWKELEEERLSLEILLQIGDTYKNTEDEGNASIAIEYLDQAYEGFASRNDLLGLVLVLSRRSAAHWLTGQTEEALADAKEGVLKAQQLGSLDLLADALSNLGLVHKRLNQTDSAVDAYNNALTLARGLRDKHQETVCLMNLGTLLLSQGKLSEAADHFEAARPLFLKRKNYRDLGKVLLRLGDIELRRGSRAHTQHSTKSFTKALHYYEEALKVFDQVEDLRGKASALNQIGVVYLNRNPKDLHASREAFTKADELYRRSDGINLFNFGRLSLEEGNAQASLELHKKAEPFLRNRQSQVSNLYGIALAYYHLGNLRKAQQSLKLLLPEVESLRRTTGREALRLAFFATKEHYYDLAIEVEMGLHDQALEDDKPETAKQFIAEALSLSEKRRSRVLLETLSSDLQTLRAQASPELLKKETGVQEKLNRAAEEWRNIASRDPNDSRVVKLEIEKRKLRKELDDVRAEIYRSTPKSEVSQSEIFKWSESKAHFIHMKRHLLYYSLGAKRSFLWFAEEGDGLQSFELPGREELERLARRTHELLSSPKPELAEARLKHIEHLSKLLLPSEMSNRLKAPRLLVVADGALSLLPFAALYKPLGSQEGQVRELIHHHEIVYLPSASVLLTFRERFKRRAPATQLALIVADPVFSQERAELLGANPVHEDLRRALNDFDLLHPRHLPGTRDEAEAIQEIGEAGKIDLLLGLDANKQAVREIDLRGYQILHFATHGLVHHDPELSGLVLSLIDREGQPIDGFLRLHEIQQLNLGAELVVLSACRTNVGQEVRGEGFLGLARGFMYAGAPRVLSSLWSVQDRATATLMKRFYWAMLEQGAPPSMALHAAQLSMLNDMNEKWRVPYAWAGITFQGEWRLFFDDTSIASRSGGQIDNEDDIDYPGDGAWCADDAEPWQQEICNLLQDSIDRLRNSESGT